MRVINLTVAPGDSQTKWTVDRDCYLLGLFNFVGTAVISNDPSLQYADVETNVPTVTGSDDRFIIQPFTSFATKFLLTAGTVLYAACSGSAGTFVQIILDELDTV